MRFAQKLAFRLTKILIWPLGRLYARAILGDRPADAFYAFLCRLNFFVVHLYWPRFKNPRSFEEKIWNRMLYVRDPRLTMLSDKWRVRDYVAGRVGADFLIPLLWSGTKPEDVPFADLPPKFVIKANHGCGYNIIVADKEPLDSRKIILKLKGWLGEKYCHKSMIGAEWAYKNIAPAILVESFLEDNGKVPVDYKLFCFSGRAEFFQMNFDRFGDPYEKTFDRDFGPLDLWQGTRQYPGVVERPASYPEMIRVAEALAAGLDFLRVDLYTIGGRIYVGELTSYPGGGFIEWIPRKYDFLLGEKWKIKPER